MVQQDDSQNTALTQDPRFIEAIRLFNEEKWYLAHDVFEELWHETSNPERKTLQGLLQVAVGQYHLSCGNRRGATILFGEGLGRLRNIGSTDLGLDIAHLKCCVEARLNRLQQDLDPDECTVPILLGKD